MPMRKFALVAEAIRHRPEARLLEPEPVSEADLLRVHTAEYIAAIRTGEPRALAESQKFPWSAALFPSVCLTNGGCLAAARQALQDGVSACLGSGFHHAHADHGEGFCTFNGLIVALEALRAQGLIQRAAILDLDLHYGNGTASLVQNRPGFFALSIYGNDYNNNTAYKDVSIKQHADGVNHRSFALSAGATGQDLQTVLSRALPLLLSEGKPDLLLYQAGADPFKADPYSPLNLDHADLRARDQLVFEFAHEHHIPIAWVLAGGYTPDITQVVQVHVNTFEACAEVFGPH
ncbi:histone deacetylase [Leptolyngbya sp. FACHB-261]|nr:histone deacetylase [Leptolyngbya sp. FACHB-261]